MKRETITKIENTLGRSGLTGYIFFKLTGDSYDNLCETQTLEEGACLVLKGTAPVRERREMFLRIYDGCKRIADHIKEDAGWTDNKK